MELSDYRTQIDRIDAELLRLFAERMQTAAGIAAYKKEHALPVLDTGREREKLAGIVKAAPEDLQEEAVSLFRLLFSLSRGYQRSLLGSSSTLPEILKRAVVTTPQLFPTSAAVACQGVEGAYSQQACDKLFQHPSVFFCATFDKVFAAIEQGLCQYGILPIENSTAGSVTKVYDLMIQHNFSIVRTFRLKVDHNLLVNPGTRLEDIREIYSHEQALNQCGGFLQSLPGVNPVSVANTAVAAQFAADSERDDVAVIAAKTCAELYNLEVVGESVSNVQSNYTRFICISRRLEIYRGARKISIMCNLPHEAGSLNSIISRLAIAGINLCKLESRPIAGREFEFRFFFDMEADLHDPEVVKLICELESRTEHFVFLGAYEER